MTPSPNPGGHPGLDEEEQKKARFGVFPKDSLRCRCGEFIRGRDEDELVSLAQAHLAERHPELSYTREQILMIAF